MQGFFHRMRRNSQRVWRSFHGMRWNPPRIRRGFCGMRRNSQRMRRSFYGMRRNSLRGVEQKTRAQGGTRTRQRPEGESEGPLRGAHGRPRAKRPERGSPCARRSPRTQRRRVKAGGRSGARAERRRATDKRTRREGRSDARGRTALRAPSATGAPRRAGIARAPRASRAVSPCVKHARHGPVAGVGSGARARTQREEAAGGKEATRTRGPRPSPPRTRARRGVPARRVRCTRGGARSPRLGRGATRTRGVGGGLTPPRGEQ